MKQPCFTITSLLYFIAGMSIASLFHIYNTSNSSAIGSTQQFTTTRSNHERPLDPSSIETTLSPTSTSKPMNPQPYSSDLSSTSTLLFSKVIHPRIIINPPLPKKATLWTSQLLPKRRSIFIACSTKTLCSEHLSRFPPSQLNAIRKHHFRIVYAIEKELDGIDDDWIDGKLLNAAQTNVDGIVAVMLLDATSSISLEERMRNTFATADNGKEDATTSPHKIRGGTSPIGTIDSNKQDSSTDSTTERYVENQIVEII